MGFIQHRLLKFLILIIIATSCKKYNNNFESHCIENFCLVEQPDEITCGPTSAFMVLNFYGLTASIEDIKCASLSHWFNYNNEPIGMTSPHLLSNAINEKGLSCNIFQGDIDQLKRNLKEDKPIIVLLRYNNWLWHYMVAIGYDKKHIILADPSNGKKIKLENNIFNNSWNFTSDINGKMCTNDSYVFLLNLTEVFPKTMIVPIT